jgi:hypothetical protein
VPVCADSSEKQIDPANSFDLGFECGALGFEIGRVAVEDVDVLAGDVDVGEEVWEHEGVVRFGVVAGEVDVFVLRLLEDLAICVLVKETNHVEGDDVFERDVARPLFFDEGFVYQLGTTSGWQAEYEGLLGCESMGFDPFYWCQFDICVQG